MLLEIMRQSFFGKRHAQGCVLVLCIAVAHYTGVMLWIKAFHIVFVTSWFAGLFYLPRIFVNIAMVSPGSVAERDRLLGMAQRLLRFPTILAVPALAFGLWLWLGFGFTGGWLHAKLMLVLVVMAYHYNCSMQLRQLQANTNQHSHRWFRWFNELPVLLLLAIVILVVVKPF